MKKVKKAKAKSKKKQNVVVLPPPRFGKIDWRVSVQYMRCIDPKNYILYIYIK